MRSHLAPFQCHPKTQAKVSIDHSFQRCNQLFQIVVNLSIAVCFIGISMNSEALASWSDHTFRVLKELEWQHVGFLNGDNGNVDSNKPILRCPCCWTYRDAMRNQQHSPSCAVSPYAFSHTSIICIHHCFVASVVSIHSIL